MTFKTSVTKLTKVLSPYYRSMRMWDMFTDDVQRATTKVQFKRLIRLNG